MTSSAAVAVFVTAGLHPDVGRELTGTPLSFFVKEEELIHLGRIFSFCRRGSKVSLARRSADMRRSEEAPASPQVGL